MNQSVRVECYWFGLIGSIQLGRIVLFFFGSVRFLRFFCSHLNVLAAGVGLV